MKKLLPVLLLLCIALLLASCAGKPSAQPDATTQSVTAADATENATAADATENATAADVPGSAAPAETADQTAQSAPPEETAAQDAQTAPADAETESQPEKTVDAFAAPATVSLVWAADWEDDIANLASCTVTEDPQTAFVICPDQTVTDFEIISLYDPEINEVGQIKFSYTTAYSHGVLMPEAPLLVRTTFYGDMPNIGIRYTDADGTSKMYAVDISGMNGSLYLMEFESGGAG